MTMPQLFDSVAVRVRSEDVGGLTTTIGFDVHDIGETWTLGLAHRALHYRRGLPPDCRRRGAPGSGRLRSPS